MSAILGLNVNSHNASSALVVDGKIAFAVEEERLNREKRTRRFPEKGINAAFEHTGLCLQDLTAVTVSVNAGIYLEALNVSHTQVARYKGEIWYSVLNRLMAMKQGNLVDTSEQALGFVDGSKMTIHYITHHLAHAASAFFVSPWERAAILSVDGFGEKDCVLFALGQENKIATLGHQEFPHSLGCFYSAMTEFLGFTPNEDEWKLMGASAYGDPNVYCDKLARVIHLKPNGLFELDLSFFNHFQFHRPGQYSIKMIQLLGPSRQPDQELEERHYDIAAATQKITEEVLFHMLNHLYSVTGVEQVCLAGGVAFNSVANGKICSETPFREVFVPPWPDDSGTSIGAALYFYHQFMNRQREYVLTSNYFGPGYSDESIGTLLKRYKICHQVLPEPEGTAAKLLCDGKIIGWFQGRLEFGDRALGNRSILADPRDPEMKDRVNETIKYREKFRPFAPSLLTEQLGDFFLNAAPTPFMEKVFMVRPEKRALIPAVTHIDGSGRLQTVSREQNARFYELIYQFWKLTGVPVVLNTSFNLKGEPVVCSPEDAIRTFFTSGLDALIIGDFLILK